MRRDSPRPVPTSTYRVQLTPEQDFATLGRLAGHLARLGVSHAYLSPILGSAPGSQHGYDVIDHSQVNGELGGEDALRAAATRLGEAGVHLLVDLVPNHMALTTPEYRNAALWGALLAGAESPYARWFDVDWDLERPLLMPVLGQRIDECLDAGEITFEPSGGPAGEPVVRYYEHVLPVRAGTEDLPLEELLGAQHYRLAYWRTADEELNYRRFFDVDTLLAIRVEDPQVFAETHAVPLRLVRDGVVSGLRIDHPDGLADPVEYLDRLAHETGDAWVVVEKILVGDEQLPRDWPCDGTTGYDALWRIGALFVDPAGEPVLRGSFAEFTGVADGWDQTVEQAKREVMSGQLVAEIDRLARVAYEICQEEVRLRDHSLRGLVAAVQELLAAFPVYRAYVRPGQPAGDDAVAVLEQAVHDALQVHPSLSSEIKLVRDMALGKLGRSARKDEFCRRFQQTCGPVIAKGVEDTAGYRWFPLSGLAEVGAEPDRFGLSVGEFCEWAESRRQAWPHTLNTLSTHDTKRSEDIRARLAVLAEMPGEWATSVRAWRDLAGTIYPPVAGDDGGPEAVPASDPTGRLDWLAWQTLVGAWPIDADRLGDYLVKAAREAKLETTWTLPNEQAETYFTDFATHVTTDEAIRGSVQQFVERLHPAFVANVLGQRAVQLVMPGVPDVYQGCEVVSLQLVDPDNRRTVDQEALDAALTRGLDGDVDPTGDLDAAKARLTALGLLLRRDHPEWLGSEAALRSLATAGTAADHAVAMARGDSVVLVATRFALRLAAAGGWRDTTVQIPTGRWRCVLTDRELVSDATPQSVGELLADWPVTLLVREDGE